ncbi:MAG: methylenetetrahydrofolate reductase [Pseudobdellovibrionaceae bacterium]
MATISFEFFPPKTEASGASFFETAALLKTYDPAFMTVTYGAGGATKEGTFEAVTRLQNETGVPAAAHITFINTDIAHLKEYTDMLWNAGIKRLIALRGDMPDDLQWPLDPDGSYFQFTSDFVEALKSWHDFDISVGAYPEVHPDAPSLAADLKALKLKCEAGADRAITQFFFENETFFRFRDAVEKMGIQTPLVPGLLPIHDLARLQSFAARCKASVPQSLIEAFDGIDPEGDEALALAEDLLAAQVEGLVAAGVDHIHFYTLNKPTLLGKACMVAKNAA